QRPTFLNGRGSIAELMRLRARRISRQFNQRSDPRPAIVEFSASDGRYYLARLFTKEHFQQESAALNHCLGTSWLAHYLSRSINGEIEIFSLRETNTHMPVVTIEYQVSAKRIVQIKTKRNQLIRHVDPFYPAALEALCYLTTGTAYDRHGAPYKRGLRDIADLHWLTPRP